MTRDDMISILEMAGAMVFVIVVAVLMALFGSG